MQQQVVNWTRAGALRTGDSVRGDQHSNTVRRLVSPEGIEQVERAQEKKRREKRQQLVGASADCCEMVK